MIGSPRVVGRYVVCAPIASGGMARVHLGRLLGVEGFSRTVAIKQLHAQLAQDPDFITMFLDEARLASRIRHPNVVAPIDVVALDGEIFIVMEYVQGEAVSRLIRASGDAPMPPEVASSVMYQVLLGLHAAHEATDERGNPLDIVHRDVSPQNILVGEDGVARIVDFGIATAARRVHSTDGGKLKGKLGYMAPEQLRLEPLDRRCDVFAAGLVLWEMLSGQKLFPPDEPAGAVDKMLKFEPRPPSELFPKISPAFDAVVVKALQPKREDRYEDARQMAIALHTACAPAPVLEVGAWVQHVAGPALRQRAAWVADAENLNLTEMTHARSAAELRALGQGVGSLPGVTPLGPRTPPPVASDSTQAFELFPRGDATGLSIVPNRDSSASRVAEPRRRRRRAWMWVLSALTLLSSIGIGAFVALRQPAPELGPATVTVIAETETTEQAALPNPTPEPTAVRVLKDAGALPTAEDAGVRAQTETRPRKREREPKSASRKTARCDVPYTVDENGIKRFRPECF